MLKKKVMLETLHDHIAKFKLDLSCFPFLSFQDLVHS